MGGVGGGQDGTGFVVFVGAQEVYDQHVCVTRGISKLARRMVRLFNGLKTVAIRNQCIFISQVGASRLNTYTRLTLLSSVFFCFCSFFS